jgi:hypothetical protein
MVSDLAGAGQTPGVDLSPDPRISNLRPGWLGDDQQWRDHLRALTRDDALWFERQWTLAGGRAPAVDVSWLTRERVW